MKVLVSRPREDAEALAVTLAARGIDAAIEPLLTIRPKHDAKVLLERGLAGAQALLFTSANGARAFAGASAQRGLPVFAVGESTARAAKAAGFAQVENAQGNVADLARLAASRLNPAKGALVHPAASDVAGDLAGDLARYGFEVRRAVIYEAVPVTSLSADTQSLIKRGGLDAALFFSPRTARSFVRLAVEAGLAASLGRVAAVSLSADVAEGLREIGWRGIAVAGTPTEAALLAALDRIDADGFIDRKAHS